MYHPSSGAAEDVCKQLSPFVEGDAGRWSFVHVNDAARATVAALTAEAGTYVIVDDDPSPVSVWLPKFATFVGAPPPPILSLDEVEQAAGNGAVYYHTNCRRFQFEG